MPFTLEAVQPDRELLVAVEQTLRRLHITGKFRGLWYLVHAVAATVNDPLRTELITKDLYPEIGRAFGASPERVERAIRAAVGVSWDRARDELDRLAGYHLDRRPTNTEFIDLVAAYIRYNR